MNCKSYKTINSSTGQFCSGNPQYLCKIHSSDYQETVKINVIIDAYLVVGMRPTKTFRSFRCKLNYVNTEKVKSKQNETERGNPQNNPTNKIKSTRTAGNFQIYLNVIHVFSKPPF